MAEERAGLEGLDDADSPEDEGVVEPRGQAGQLLRLWLSRGGYLQQPPRRLQRLDFSTGIVGVGGHRSSIPVPSRPNPSHRNRGRGPKRERDREGEAPPHLYAFKGKSRNT